MHKKLWEASLSQKKNSNLAHFEKFLNQNLKFKIFTVFILPPSREELFKRLLNREKNDEKIASKRMKKFDEDVLHWVNYDFVVINDDIENCCTDILQFIKRDAQELKYNKEIIEKHVNKLII